MCARQRRRGRGDRPAGPRGHCPPGGTGMTAADVEPTPAGPTPPAPSAERPRTDIASLFVMLGLIVALGVIGSWWAVALVGALAVIIFLHELGHYLMAKSAGMK